MPDNINVHVYVYNFLLGTHEQLNIHVNNSKFTKRTLVSSYLITLFISIRAFSATQNILQ